MSDTNYIFAVTRIRGKENQLLTEGFMHQLVEAKDVSEVVRLLRDKGWDTGGTGDPAKILEDERAKTWDFLREILKEDIHKLDVFLYAQDYMNLKSAVKAQKLKHPYEGIYGPDGTIPVSKIVSAVEKKQFETLPGDFGKLAADALDTFLHTGDGQLSDVMIDRAALDSIYAAGKKSGSDFLKQYAEITVASADLKVALRAAHTGKNRDFYEKALAECKSLDKATLIKAAEQGPDALADYLSMTDYAGGVDAFRTSMSAFERWCDNLLIEKTRPQKYNPFGLDPVAAYVLARENEIKSVRIVLLGKENGLPASFIEERVREMYA